MSASSPVDTPIAGSDFDAVPIIDFAGMRHGDAEAKQRVAAAFKHACTQVGFFYLASHGVPETAVADVFALAQRFFALPLDAKMRWHLSGSAHACGFVALHGERGDLHEAIDFAAEDRQIDGRFCHGDFRQASNLWPDDIPEFRDIVTRYSDALRRLTTQLFGAFALALDLPEDYFGPMTDRPISLLRLLHYPSQANPKADGFIGVQPHTDHECFTILCQDDVGGLQVRNRAGNWVAVPRVPGTFVVNIGDQLARWSNDRFASSLHRVINVSGRERYSVPFFVGANEDAVIAALPSCVDAANPARYEPIVAGDYTLELIRQGYRSAQDVPQDD